MIGIISGNFDPLHNGHINLIKDMHMIFETVVVVVGNNPNKKRLFSQKESMAMIQDSLDDWSPIVDFLDDENIIGYIKRKFAEEYVTIVRGVRSAEDAQYELNNTNAIRHYLTEKENKLIRHTYLPAKDTACSSSLIKELSKQSKWDSVKQYVSEYVLIELKKKYAFLQALNNHPATCMVAQPELASIFEQTTAGFAPTKAETMSEPSTHGAFQSKIYGGVSPSKSRGLSGASTNRHKMEMVDELENIIKSNINFGKMPTHFHKMVEFGLMSYSKVIDRAQVMNMLDPCPVDVTSSQSFILKQIPIDSVLPTGERYKSKSESLGPIIVDYNEEFPNIPSKAIVVEGKHRWLDAKEAGKKTILAWVGEDALPYVKEKL